MFGKFILLFYYKLVLWLMCIVEFMGVIIVVFIFFILEDIGGVCNWDYCYFWVCDLSFFVYIFFCLGFWVEVDVYMDFIVEWMVNFWGLDGGLFIMFIFWGGIDIFEMMLDYFEGYWKSSFVRIGNGVVFY